MNPEEKAAYEKGLQAGLAAKKAKRLKELEEKGKADAQKGPLIDQALDQGAKLFKKVFG